MTFQRLLSALVVTSCVAMNTAAQADDCTVLHSFRGLVFDAGAVVAVNDMEQHLDRALTYGVEKTVLYPNDMAEEGNQPADLEEVFPDLVIQGQAPWHDGAPVVWADNVMEHGLLGLEKKLLEQPGQMFVLGNFTRFNLVQVQRLLKNHRNLWIGFGRAEIDTLVESCATGEVAAFMRKADGRVVFASSGGDMQWKNYKWTLRKLKKLSSYLSIKESDAFLFRNAEELFNIAVNAP
ncbi:hypothetical protein RYZ26_13740 [Terasakiella sp. A23]|uniref:hypothetical protein n=1 Tax=Terasakiella sp. FCG-A23 TaxID=3080561 RepID=UPI002954B3BB|nr:hypothetical protein [Terasakiella sp. A23]MDV7340663.1 hypothetical protein [Terasakiella sp. A23]